MPVTAFPPFTSASRASTTRLRPRASAIIPMSGISRKRCAAKKLRLNDQIHIKKIVLDGAPVDRHQPDLVPDHASGAGRHYNHGSRIQPESQRGIQAETP